MGFLDIFKGDKKGEGRHSNRRDRDPRHKQGRSLEEQGTQLDEAIRIIRKHPYMKYTFDDALLSAIEKSQQELLMNQQMILDSVTVKDPKKGDIGLAEYLVSGSLLEQFNSVKSIGGGPEDGAPERKALEGLVGKLNQKIESLETELSDAETKNNALIAQFAELKETETKSLSKRAVERKMQKIDRALSEMKPKKVQEVPGPLPKMPVSKATPADIPDLPGTAKAGGIGKIVKGLSSLIGASKFLQKKAKYTSFTDGNFFFEYPDWVPDLNVSEDVILSVSSGACGVEASVKKLYPLTFGGYVSKVVTLVKTQLKATVLAEKTGVDHAYLEFSFKQGNLAWLYKAKVIECDSKFYTVAVKMLQSDEQKYNTLAEYVLGSVKCAK